MRVGQEARIKRWMVRDVIERSGGMTRVEIEEHFKASRTTVQFHLTSMRESDEIFIADWRKPVSTGSWSPVWAIRTSSDQQDTPQPMPNRRRWEDADSDEPIIVQAHGVKSEHARVARARHDEFGMWGQLVRGTRCRVA